MNENMTNTAAGTILQLLRVESKIIVILKISSSVFVIYWCIFCYLIYVHPFIPKENIVFSALEHFKFNLKDNFSQKFKLSHYVLKTWTTYCCWDYLAACWCIFTGTKYFMSLNTCTHLYSRRKYCIFFYRILKIISAKNVNSVVTWSSPYEWKALPVSSQFQLGIEWWRNWLK